MTTKLIMDIESPTEPLTRLFITTLWLVALLLLAQLVLGLVFGVYYSVQNGDNNNSDAFDAWFSAVPTLLSITLMSPLNNIPLLMKATPAASWPERLNFWAINPINKQGTIKYLFIAFVFWLVLSLIEEMVNLPIEQFMLDVKASGDSVVMLMFIFITICIVVPIMEEIVFRGWLFSKIALTKLGNIGALIITSLAFTAIHSQYEQIITLFMVLALGILLGFIRYKSNNISYSIIVHMLFNSSATIALFLLPS